MSRVSGSQVKLREAQWGRGGGGGGGGGRRAAGGAARSARQTLPRASTLSPAHFTVSFPLAPISSTAASSLAIERDVTNVLPSPRPPLVRGQRQVDPSMTFTSLSGARLLRVLRCFPDLHFLVPAKQIRQPITPPARSRPVTCDTRHATRLYNPSGRHVDIHNRRPARFRRQHLSPHVFLAVHLIVLPAPHVSARLRLWQHYLRWRAPRFAIQKPRLLSRVFGFAV
jgi:hypothetical protein